MITLWNTEKRTFEELLPSTSGEFSMYCCGPTVYALPHIGNYRAYIVQDILRRTLESISGLRIKHVMNITDVGHLTDDADAGQDKIEKAATGAGRSAQDIVKEISDIFIADLDRLNIERPTAMPRATEYISQQIELVQLLEEKGFTYKTSDGIYFDTSKFPTYGRLSRQQLDEKQSGGRVETNEEKKHPSDFALWKFSPAGSKRQMEWASPWGVGFPGWHIECSVMSRVLLGQPFDLHAGGVDHIAVHHENEIAQSEAAYGVPLARYWMHNEFLLVDGQKMSKSLGNVYTIEDLMSRGLDPLAFRYFLLGAQYRQKQNFTWEALEGAWQSLKKLRMIVRSWNATSGKEDPVAMAAFIVAMEDDLNTPRALSVVWRLVDSDLPSANKAVTIRQMDRVLGLDLESYIGVPIEVPKEIEELMTERAHAREQKDWSTSDTLREEMASRGWTVEDTATGQRAQPK